MIKRKICKIDNCSYPVWARGFCKFHDRGKKSSISKTPIKRIPAVSSKQLSRLAEYRVVRDSFLKGKTCEFPNCQSNDVTLHHMKGRLGYLLCDIRYFKALCMLHHRFVEDNPAEALKLGLSVKRL